MKEAIGLAIIAIITISLLLALPVMLLWNMTMPQLFGLSSITFSQALQLTLLCRLLFGRIIPTRGE